MEKYTLSEVESIVEDTLTDSLDVVLRKGARKMLQVALENEVSEYISRYQDHKDDEGHRLVVRNGYHKPREVATGVGKVGIKQPRVLDHREGVKFTRAILPKYARRSPSIDTLIPALYLKGISTSSFPEALEAILGKGVSGLSSANIVRLKKTWEDDYQAWQERDLSDKHYVYIWADGIYFNVRLDDQRPCVLVLLGATKEGKKEVLAIEQGQRESKLSWQNLLQNLKSRGLTQAPAIAIAVGDGALGFWSALEEEFPQTKMQRCWVHKTANILDKLPKSVQGQAKHLIHEMYMSPTKEEAYKVYERFMALYQDKYPKACECLKKDKEVLFTFYNFPAKHWQHLRSTNPIESTFATVRHRTRQTKGCGSVQATLTMVFKLALGAQNTCLRLRGSNLIPLVAEGGIFEDGELKNAA
jgi:putative transposase